MVNELPMLLLRGENDQKGYDDDHKAMLEALGIPFDSLPTNFERQMSGKSKNAFYRRIKGGGHAAHVQKEDMKKGVSQEMAAAARQAVRGEVVNFLTLLS